MVLAAVGAVVAVVALVVAGVVVASGSDDPDERSDRSDRSEAEERDEAADPDEAGDEPDGPVFVPVEPGAPDEPAATDPPADPIAPTGEPVDLDVVDLEAALLGQADVLDHAAVSDATPQTSDRLTSADMIVSDECRALLEEHEARGSRPNFGGAPAAAPRYAAQRFEGPDGTLEHEIADGVDVTIDDYRELLTTCETIEWDGVAGGSSGRLRFTVLDEPRPELGDDALHVEYAFNGAESIVRWTLWSRDSVISSVSVSVVGGAGRSSTDMAEAQCEDAALRADTILAQVISER